MKAIGNGYFASWPGLTAKVVQQHFPESEETQGGQTRNKPPDLRSTMVKVPTEGNPTYDHRRDSEEEDENGKKSKVRPKKKHKEFFERVIDLQDAGQTGKFPVRSSEGNQYLLIMCEIDSDAILFEPIRDRTTGERTKTYQQLVDKLNACGIY